MNKTANPSKRSHRLFTIVFVSFRSLICLYFREFPLTRLLAQPLQKLSIFVIAFIVDCKMSKLKCCVKINPH